VEWTKGGRVRTARAKTEPDLARRRRSRYVLEAATTFADPVGNIDPSAWSGPGLGVWDLRALVGHTSRALVTVLTYLDQPADTEAIDSPERYYALPQASPTTLVRLPNAPVRIWGPNPAKPSVTWLRGCAVRSTGPIPRR